MRLLERSPGREAPRRAPLQRSSGAGQANLRSMPSLSENQARCLALCTPWAVVHLGVFLPQRGKSSLICQQWSELIESPSLQAFTHWPPQRWPPSHTQPTRGCFANAVPTLITCDRKAAFSTHIPGCTKSSLCRKEPVGATLLKGLPVRDVCAAPRLQARQEGKSALEWISRTTVYFNLCQQTFWQLT